MAVYYLDIDDEITSAAARIRGTDDVSVVLVLPAGSRIATSRINFRLLAREALQRNRRLAIVAPEASARALAATAGLPVFASTREYEATLSEAAAAAAAAEAAPAPAPAGGVVVPAADRPAAPVGSQARAASSVRDAGRGRVARGSVPQQATETARPGPSTGLGPEGDREGPSRPRRRRRAAFLVGLLIVVFLAVAGGAAAYLLLPSASIVLTVRSAPVGPLELTVTADPAVTVADPASGVVPATLVQIPLSASGTFPATGKRVDQAPATGSVRWRNCDPTRAYTIPQGTLVRTQTGVAFATDEALFLPVAILNVPTITCESRVVPVTAATPGPSGNVAANTITVIPGDYNSVVISVVNPAPTSGGIKNVYPKVTQKDVNAALATLGTELDTQLATAAAAPAGLPAGSTAFPETATRGDAAPTLDPTTLVDQEVAQFDLGVTATGTVVTVDQASILAIGQARLAAAVPAGRDVVAGSAQVTVGPGTPVGQRVQFGVNAQAESAPRVDQAALLAQLKGRSPAEARSILAAYGDASITVWPDWATTIPTLDARIDLRVVGLPVAAPSASPPGSTAP